MQNAGKAPPNPPGYGKKKKKNKKNQQPAFLAKLLNPNLRFIQANVKVPKPVQPWAAGNQQRFPAPFVKPDKPVVELIDDTSPNVTAPTWKPVGNKTSPVIKTAPVVQPAAGKPPQLKDIKGSRALKWLEFKKSLEKREQEKLIKKKMEQLIKFPIPNLMKPEDTKEDFSKDVIWELNEQDNQSKKVVWELNDNDEKQPIGTPSTSQQQATTSKTTQNPAVVKKTTQNPAVVKKTTQNPVVVKGLPSDIKLVLQNNQKSVMAQKSTTPKPKEKKSQNIGKNNENPNKEPVKYITTRNINEMLNKGPVPGRGPAGVPKSFLMQQRNNMGAITPQSDNADNQPPANAWQHCVVPPVQQHPIFTEISPMLVQTNIMDSGNPMQYSPSTIYDITGTSPNNQDPLLGSESPDSQGAQKRLSAFQRLGPVTQPKKPKLTINLLCNKDESVREVLDETEEEDKFAPVHHRQDIKDSKDETVVKYLPHWPWKRPMIYRKKVSARNSKSVMLLELEQMEEVYERENIFIQVSVHGYPPSWKKEHVLDVVLEAVKGKSFIPCFTEFTPQECKFLVIRSRSALTTIHKLGFYIRKDDVELGVTISQTELSLKQMDFIPRLILRKRLAQGYDGERKLTISEFTTKFDISHFIYFPLNRVTNQTELVQLQSAVAWDFLTDLDLSHNRITSLEGFNLPSLTPKLKNLDISFNYIEKISPILRMKDLSLRTLKVEGNPLCQDYIDPAHYVKVFRMIFPGLVELDGIPIQLRGELPSFKRNYCPSEAKDIAERFLEIFFPLLDASLEDRPSIAELYDEKASMSVTFRYKLRYSPVYKYCRSLFNRARIFDEGEVDSIDGAEDIAKQISKWPKLQHDPYTFNVDIMHHSEFATILRVTGLLKLTAESLAEDEHLLHFTRTLVLTTRTGAEYKIQNELLYWDLATKECADKAFQVNSIASQPLNLKFESAPDADVKQKLLEIFVKITDLDEKASEKCLEMKEWHLKNALEYVKYAVTQDSLVSLYS